MRESKKGSDDGYAHGMDWMAAQELEGFELTNYRKYQYDLVGEHVRGNVLEIGRGDGSFTNRIVQQGEDVGRLVSIEPSSTLTEAYEGKYTFPDTCEFLEIDLFDMTPEEHGIFDTIILIHVLEHVERDRDAVSHLHSLLAPGGKILIEVPAMPFLYSVHDEMLGHHRRYSKKIFRNMVDASLFRISDLWFQDAIGILGSFYFFKLRRTRLNTDEGVGLVKSEGVFYDKYVIPLEALYEKFVRLPFGLSLSGILERQT